MPILKLSPNKRARDIAQKMIGSASELQIGVEVLENGTTVLDCGINHKGSFAAGKLFAEVCLGGLGTCELDVIEQDGLWMPAVKVTVDNPSAGCMGCQYAGWIVQTEKYFAMGSGPARIKCAAEDIIKNLGYADESDCAVIALETGKLPGIDAAQHIAEKASVDPKELYILVAPTASITGSIQINARVVETGLHKLVELGFDIKKIVAGLGTCPIAPVAEDDLKAIGITNDCVLYGGRVWYTVDAAAEDIEKVLDKIPSSSSRDYGTPFYELYKKYGNFYDIDPMLFSPAEVWLNCLCNGKTYHAGQFNTRILKNIFETSG